MDYVSLSLAGRRIVNEYVDDIRDNPRYEDRSILVELEPGEYRHVAKGGFWNDTSGRAYGGVTKADVDGCKRELKAAGIIASWDDVDGLLLQAVMGYTGVTMSPDEVQAKWRTKRQLARDRARDAGRCIICLKNECAPKATCVDCGKKANEARKRRKVAA